LHYENKVILFQNLVNVDFFCLQYILFQSLFVGSILYLIKKMKKVVLKVMELLEFQKYGVTAWGLVVRRSNWDVWWNEVFFLFSRASV